jgi:O-antigen ligase
MSELTKLEELTDGLKIYLKESITILKLELISKIATTGSAITGMLVVAASVFLVILSGSIGLGFYLSAKLGDTYSGFAIVAAFYLLLAVVLSIGRKKIIENPIRNNIITKILAEKKYKQAQS